LKIHNVYLNLKFYFGLHNLNIFIEKYILQYTVINIFLDLKLVLTIEVLVNVNRIVRHHCFKRIV